MSINSYSIVIVPGLGGSGANHWQTKWQHIHPSFIRCEQIDWARPYPSVWIETLEKTVSSCLKPVVIVAHSLGCITTVKWLETSNLKIKGVLLVAPADTDSKNCIDVLKSFSNIPQNNINIPTTVVASQNDPYISLTRAQQLAFLWGAKFLDVGMLGHINADSNIGEWRDGLDILDDLIKTV